MFQIVGFKLTVKNDRFKMELRTYRIPPSALFSSSPSWDIEQLFRQIRTKWAEIVPKRARRAEQKAELIRQTLLVAQENSASPQNHSMERATLLSRQQSLALGQDGI
jgi:hypothetical protein